MHQSPQSHRRLTNNWSAWQSNNHTPRELLKRMPIICNNSCPSAGFGFRWRERAKPLALHSLQQATAAAATATATATTATVAVTKMHFGCGRHCDCDCAGTQLCGWTRLEAAQQFAEYRARVRAGGPRLCCVNVVCHGTRSSATAATGLKNNASTNNKRFERCEHHALRRDCRPHRGYTALLAHSLTRSTHSRGFRWRLYNAGLGGPNGTVLQQIPRLHDLPERPSRHGGVLVPAG